MIWDSRRVISETEVPPEKQKEETVDRNRRRTVVGIVVSDKMDKTIAVEIERRVQHPVFGKTLRKFYRCYAHDEKNEAKSGDKVELMETRPLSKMKTWRLLRVITKAPAAAAAPTVAAASSSAEATEDRPASS